MEHLKEIQTHLFKNNLEQNKEALNKSLIVLTDPSLENLKYAEKNFNFVESPSLFSYNVMIKAYVKSYGFKKALGLFDQLRIQGLWADNFTYPFVFKAIACLGEVLLGRKIHGFAIKCGIEYDCYVCNSMMDMYAMFGLIGVVKKLFDEMPARDSVSWNVLISGYVKCGQFEDAIRVFKRMNCESSLKPDEATIVSTLSACTSLKILELGKEIHYYVANKFRFTEIINNALLDMYSKCGCLDIARQIFDAMPVKNLICWTSMVSGYVNCGQLDEARVLFERSPSRDIVLWTAMINGYVQFNRVEEAVDLFREMQIRKVKPDIYAVVTLLTGCAQLGALEQGKWIHEYIIGNNLRIDAIVGTALIDMYSKCGCIDKSLEIFRGLKGKDTALWTSIICGLATNGKTRIALDLFSEMKLAGFRPDDITFIGVLTACSHGGFVNEGRNYFNSMKNIYQIEPKLEHYGCFVDLLGRAGQLVEAERLLEQVPEKNDGILIPLYGTLLSACRTYGYFEMAERLARKLTKIENKDSGVHTLMANMYASVERWEDVTMVREKMKSLGVKKSPGCSSIEIDGKVHEFLVGDLSHPEMNEVHLMLETIARSMLNLEEIDLEQNNVVADFS